MEKLVKLNAVAVPLPIDNLDTDQIMPKQFLRGVDKSGLAKGTFFNLRCYPDGTRRPDCVFNKPGYEKAGIIVSSPNFGCGSSREHAPQSLWHYGFRGIIAQSFAEIFFGNSTTLGIPCVCASAEDIAKIGELIEADPELPVEINLENMTLSCGDFSCKCSMPENARAALMSGTWDPIAGLIDAEDEIAKTAANLPYYK